MILSFKVNSIPSRNSYSALAINRWRIKSKHLQNIKTFYTLCNTFTHFFTLTCKKIYSRVKLSWFISRILLKMIIYLDIVLPQYSSNLPKSKASNFVRFLFGFASGWSLQCLKCYHLSGKLLPYLFTLTNNGGLFSVALSVSSRFPGVTWRPAL